MTPFGRARRSRRVEHLRNRVRSDACVRVIDSARSAPSPPAPANRASAETVAAEQVTIDVAAGDAATARARRVRRRPRRPCPGVSDAHSAAERREFAGEQRVRRRDRGVGHAGVHRGERQQAVLDAVARQDHERAVRRDAAIEQSLRQRRGRAQRVAVCQPRHVAGRVALCEKRAIGRVRAPNARAAR